MAKNYTLALRKSMKQLGTYRPEYESAIAIAAQLMEQYDTLTRAFEESGWAYETSTATGTKKAPIVTTLESLRKDVLAYLSALGLTRARRSSTRRPQPKRRKIRLSRRSRI